MGFLDNVRDALKDAVSTRASKGVAAKDDVAVDESDRATAVAPVIPAETEAREAKFENYTVKSGDTLAEIGARFGVSPLEIAELNSIENPDLIFPGQVFRIPRN